MGGVMKFVKLYIPDEYKDLSKDKLKLLTNGCGPAGWKYDLVPDKIYGLCIKRACDIHDICYFYGKTNEDKATADRIFFNNILRIIDQGHNWWLLKFLRRRRAKKYFYAVKWFGGPAFWNNKNDDKNTIEIYG
uniref:DUF1353 domain-containing protein n=1 Tax=viral metagenome TaxID=1070528 RepID=A0A6M3IQ10_9ZZZZ